MCRTCGGKGFQIEFRVVWNELQGEAVVRRKTTAFDRDTADRIVDRLNTDDARAGAVCEEYTHKCACRGGPK